MTHTITSADLKQYAAQLHADNPSYAVIQRAVTMNGISKASEHYALGAQHTTVFSDEIETGAVTDQKVSGRCWLFSALNTIRHQMVTDFKMDDLELSESYNYFFDKLEKSNVFLEEIIASADKPLDDRYVTYILDGPQGDGGWWHYAADIITKYGVVPKSAMPEAEATSDSRQLNTLLDRLLRKGALELRRLIAEKKSEETVQAHKQKILAEVYAYLTIAIGTPPASFNFAFKDKDKKFHRDENITPQEFLKKYSKIDFEGYVAVLNDPSPEKSYNTVYEFEGAGGAMGGRPTRFLNLPMEELRTLAHKQIKTGESIWFGCDVRTDTNKKGFMTLDTFAYDETFGVDFSLDKADRLATHDSSVNHAMTITGVDVVDGEPRQWKVENSWGDEVGTKGYYTMSNQWFDKNGYVVVIRKDLLTAAQRKASETEPVMIPRWDPLNDVIA